MSLSGHLVHKASVVNLWSPQMIPGCLGSSPPQQLRSQQPRDLLSEIATLYLGRYPYPSTQLMENSLEKI